MRPSLALACLLLTAALAPAHPVPKDNHDRTIVVRLQKGEKPNRVRVRVEYRLEVDEVTVFLNDMKDFKDEINPLDYRGRPLDYYAQFTRIFAPIYADRLVARVNNQPIEPFRWSKPSQRLVDEDGKSLGHLRCDFVFESGFDLHPDRKTEFTFREQNYLLEPGLIHVSLVNETGLPFESKTQPDDALHKRAALNQLQPGDDDRLRALRAVVAPPVGAAPRPPEPKATAPPKTPEPARSAQPDAHEDDHGFRRVFQDDYGFWLTMLLAFVFGAAHALTPGHGKTLVAAYLVGERGTIWHAGFLGLVTTLTHTGVVILLAVIMTLLPADLQQSFKTWIQNGLGLGMGLIIACMGFWLLLQRVAGRADHLHLDGGHHHHHADAPTPSSATTLSWWGLVALGVTGGLIPCWDAIALLLYSVGRSDFWLVLPAVLAFSAGLAVVLVVIGVCVVQVPRFVESRWGAGRVTQALPIVSAILVTVMGLWLCYEGVHGK